MVIYLIHPVHGTKVAISEEEASADCLNGWKRTTLAQLMKKEELPPDDDDDADEISKDTSSRVAENFISIEALRDQWKAKFGKEPHHRKSAATLQKELAG